MVLLLLLLHDTKRAKRFHSKPEPSCLAPWQSEKRRAKGGYEEELNYSSLGTLSDNSVYVRLPELARLARARKLTAVQGVRIAGKVTQGPFSGEPRNPSCDHQCGLKGTDADLVVGVGEGTKLSTSSPSAGWQFH